MTRLPLTSTGLARLDIATNELLDEVIAMVAGHTELDEVTDGNVKPAAVSLNAPYCGFVTEPIVIVYAAVHAEDIAMLLV